MGETTDVWILPHVEGWYQVGCAVCEFAAHEQDYAAAYEIADLHLGDHSPRPRTSSSVGIRHPRWVRCLSAGRRS
jgi:hypothetical protein